jgi:hypothetical protein
VVITIDIRYNRYYRCHILNGTETQLAPKVTAYSMGHLFIPTAYGVRQRQRIQFFKVVNMKSFHYSGGVCDTGSRIFDVTLKGGIK